MFDVYALVFAPPLATLEFVQVARLRKEKDALDMCARYKARGRIAAYMPEDGGEVVFFDALKDAANHSRFIGVV